MRQPLRKFLKLAVHPATIAGALLACVLGLYVLEQQAAHMPFVIVTLLTIAAAAYLASARPAFSLFTGMAIMTVTSLISVVKYRTKGFDFHVYDIVFTGTDPEAIRFLFAEFGYAIIPLIAVLIAGVIALGVIWRADQRARWKWHNRAALFACSAIALPLTYPLDPTEPRYFHYLGGFNASSFYVSFLDLPFGERDLPLAGRLQGLPGEMPFGSEVDCGDTENLPDVFFVLSESTANLRIFPQLESAALDQEFRSQDGKVRELHVETFAGGTWVTNLSLMTGLSSADFGWRAPYLTTALEGRVAESLPHTLARCGYRTAAMLPMKHGFVNEGPFMESIGFETVLDYDAIGASEYAHRDAFYFAAAEKFIAKHRAEDGRPLFMEIQTMFAHSPYVTSFAPEIEFPGQPWTDDAELNEYVRRVLISQTDFRGFLDRRADEMADHQSVVMEFGDHQSSATKPLVDEITGGNSLADLRSAAYKTYFSVHSYGRDLDMKPLDWPSLDVAYLGASVLQAGRLPISPMFSDLAELRDNCAGRFYDCPHRDAVDRHLKRRIDSGLLTLP
jgi:Sulfatase